MGYKFCRVIRIVDSTIVTDIICVSMSSNVKITIEDNPVLNLEDNNFSKL